MTLYSLFCRACVRACVRAFLVSMAHACVCVYIRVYTYVCTCICVCVFTFPSCDSTYFYCFIVLHCPSLICPYFDNSVAMATMGSISKLYISINSIDFVMCTVYSEFIHVDMWYYNAVYYNNITITIVLCIKCLRFIYNTIW